MIHAGEEDRRALDTLTRQEGEANRATTQVEDSKGENWEVLQGKGKRVGLIGR